MGYVVEKCPCYQVGQNIFNEDDNCFRYGKCESAFNKCPIKRILTKCHRYELEFKRVSAKKDCYSDEWQAATAALADFSFEIDGILGRKH